VPGGSVQTDMAKHRWFALAVCLVLALPSLAACATSTGSDRSGGSTGVESDPASGASSGAGSTGNPGATDPGTKKPGEEDPGDMLDPDPPGIPKTLRGAGSEGVEAGCVVFQADDGNVYQLIGGDRTLILSGARLEVEVLIQKDLMTTCQQGTPAFVQTARKI
jgi:hypothetical protein